MIVQVIPDLHIPFEHPDALRFCAAIKNKWCPDRVVFLGDEIDSHAISDWPKDPEADGAGPELAKAVKRIKSWYKAFPHGDVCISNHTNRGARKAFAAGIPKAFLKSINEVLEAPAGWRWASEWEHDGVFYEHGDKLAGGLSGPQAVLREVDYSVVYGHVHSRFSIAFKQTKMRSQFAMTPGCLIDRKALAFGYFSGKNLPMLGCGLVNDGIPMLIPMPLNEAGRWTGKL